jgi:hypothetical protein
MALDTSAFTGDSGKRTLDDIFGTETSSFETSETTKSTLPNIDFTPKTTFSSFSVTGDTPTIAPAPDIGVAGTTARQLDTSAFSDIGSAVKDTASEIKEFLIPGKVTPRSLARLLFIDSSPFVPGSKSEDVLNIPIQKGLDYTLNTETGRKAIETVADKTSDLGIKSFAAFQAANDPNLNFDQAYEGWKIARDNPENNVLEKFSLQLQDSLPQTSIGVALSFVPFAGKPLASTYFAALSADEQIKKDGKVTSVGNIAIDVVGDRMLGDSLTSVLGSSSKSILKSIFANANIEGSTEVAQSFLKMGNDYKNARTQEERDVILAEAKRYITSGDILMEYSVGSVSGGILGGGADFLQQAAELHQSTTPGQRQAGFIKLPGMDAPISNDITVGTTGTQTIDIIDGHFESIDTIKSEMTPVQIEAMGGEAALIQRGITNISDGLRVDGIKNIAAEVKAIDTNTVKTVEDLKAVVYDIYSNAVESGVKDGGVKITQPLDADVDVVNTPDVTAGRPSKVKKEEEDLFDEAGEVDTGVFTETDVVKQALDARKERLIEEGFVQEESATQVQREITPSSKELQVIEEASTQFKTPKEFVDNFKDLEIPRSSLDALSDIVIKNNEELDVTKLTTDQKLPLINKELTEIFNKAKTEKPLRKDTPTLLEQASDKKTAKEFDDSLIKKEEARILREIQGEVLSEDPAKILNKHFGKSSDTISQQLENAKTNKKRATFIEDKIAELNYDSIEEAQEALDSYKERRADFNETTKKVTRPVQKSKTRGSRAPKKPSKKESVRTAVAFDSLLRDKKVKVNLSNLSKDQMPVSIDTRKGGFFEKSFKKIQNTERFQKVQEEFQDNWVRIKRLMEKEGVTFTDQSNPFQKQQLFYGRVGALEENLIKDLEDIQADIKGIAKENKVKPKVIQGDINDFLYARHAIERNAKLGDGKAGIKTKDAKILLEKINNLEYSKDVVKVAEAYQGIGKETLDMLLDGEIISKELHTKLRKIYPNHVPLNRIIEGETNDEFVQLLSTKGFNVSSSKPLQRAKGNEDLAVRDITENIVVNYVQALERSEKNKVNLATLRMIRENDTFDGLFKEVKPPSVPVAKRDGETIFAPDRSKLVNDPSVLSVRENGEQKYIKINNPKIAIAMQGLGKQEMGPLIRSIAVITRFYSGLLTRFNPEFFVGNILRDTQDLFVNAIEGQGVKGAAKTLGAVPQAGKDIADWMRGKDTPGAKLYEQMRIDGGTTGGLGLSTRNEIEVSLKNIRRESGNIPLKLFKKSINGIDAFNTLFEDATRLASYKASLKAGLSRDKAAFIAKNATVNFNTKGNSGPIINALYMFANASIQGSTRTMQAMRDPKTAAVVISTVGGIVWAAQSMNDALDEDWREKVSDYDKDHGIIFVLPSSDDEFNYITIPVSWGLKPIKIMMDRSYEMAHGKGDGLLKSTGDVLASFWNAYNPAGGSDFYSAITPTILDIPSEVVRNKGWHGGIIYPDWKKGLPGSEQVFKSTNETLTGKSAIQTAKILEKVGVNFSPELLKYIYNQMIGGVGKFTNRAIDTSSAVIKGDLEGLNPKDVPFINRFYKSKDMELIEKQMQRASETNLKDMLQKESSLEERKDLIRDYIRDMDGDDARSLLFKLREVGHSTKGVSYSENPKKPSAKDGTFEDWYAYYRSRKFSNSREEAEELASNWVKTGEFASGADRGLNDIFGTTSSKKSLNDIFGAI